MLIPTLRAHPVALLCTLLAIVAAPGRAAEATTNGNFENFAGGLPVGWSYSQGDGPSSLLDTATVSPFTNVYPASTASVAWSDGTTTAGTPSLAQTFAAQAGTVVFGFDFRLSSFGTQPWLIAGASSTTVNFNNIRIAESGQFNLSDEFGTVGAAIALNVWYQAQFLLNYSSGTYTASLTPFGGTATTFGTRTMFNPGGSHATNLARITISDSFGATGAQSAAMWLDNVSVVPEPGCALLLGLGALALAARRRR